MRRAFILLSLLIGLAGCGDLAPTDAIVDGPEDATTEIPNSSASSTVFYRPLDFTVTNEDGAPIPKVQIEFFSGGVAQLTDINGTLLSNPDASRDETDDRGIGRISTTLTVPGCTGTNDVVVDGSVLATVGSASKLWTSTITRKCTAVTP